MKVETLSEMLTWSSAIHSQLAEHMSRGAEANPDGPARWLMEYISKHEARMASQLESARDKADSRALKTWVYEWLEAETGKPEEITEGADRHETIEAVARAVFDAHEEIMKVVRTVAVRADIPEVQELIEEVRTLEEGHGRQISQQMNRIGDM